MSAELGTVLSIWAHPDDETYLAAGVMAAASDRGDRVVCVSATAGEHGTSDPDGWPPLRLGRRRRWEAAAAMAVLGVTEHCVLGLPDGALADYDEQGLAAVGQLIDEVRPDTILTFGPDGMTFHDDHVTVSRWVTAAWRKRGCPGRLLYAALPVEHFARFGAHYEEWGVYMSDERPAGVRPDELAVYMRLDGWQLDRKVAALAAMSSQTGTVMTEMEPAVYSSIVAEEGFVEAAPVSPDMSSSAYAVTQTVRAGGRAVTASTARFSSQPL